MYSFPGAVLAHARKLRPVTSSRRAKRAFSRFWNAHFRLAQMVIPEVGALPPGGVPQSVQVKSSVESQNETGA